MSSTASRNSLRDQDGQQRSPVVPCSVILVTAGLLTASTSIQRDRPDFNDLAELERQETSGNVPERHILATHSQNSEAADPVASGLTDAWRAWAEQHEPRELRKVLLAIMGLLDE